VVKSAQRAVVGAHYGLADWLAQRVTAVVIAAWTLLLLGIVAWHGGLDHDQWRALWSNVPFKLATFAVAVAVAWHAWVGVRNIAMDYLKPLGVRLTVQALTIAALVVYVGWTVQILFGVAG
jgi:succinate dehydrogenase / fumarate reductase membrane anchor subunit